MILKAKDLHVAYGPIKALHGVSFYVDPGEVVALIGANGSGKTTLLKTVAGLLKPTSGEIHFNGQRIDGQSGHAINRKGIALVPEGRRIFPQLTVKENLEMGAFNRKDNEIESDLAFAYQLFPILKDRLAQHGGTLSGGEQQMLAIARALMSRPKLLMLDEPSMGLSPVMVDRVFKAIADINKKGVTIFLVEQNARAALGMAARGYVIETGVNVLEDRTENLLINDKVKQCYLGMQEGHLI
jgi:branched-chain amino acid transport system ATP-binding protein